MSEYTRVQPGEVRHKDGWTVYFRGRWLVVYELGPNIGEMEIEHGSESDTLYPDSFRWTMPQKRDATAAERTLITSRVGEAMHFMSAKRVDIRSGRA